MRRRGNISKRCMVCIMSAMMMMSSVTGTMITPIGAYATPYATTTQVPEDTDGHRNLTSEDTLDVNDGTIHENNGTIVENAAGATVDINNNEIQKNEGIVVENAAGATVGTQNEIIIGEVTNNYGTAENSLVESNYGTANNSKVIENFSTGRVTGAGSTVSTNHGGFVEEGINVEVNEQAVVPASQTEAAPATVQDDPPKPEENNDPPQAPAPTNIVGVKEIENAITAQLNNMSADGTNGEIMIEFGTNTNIDADMMCSLLTYTPEGRTSVNEPIFCSFMIDGVTYYLRIDRGTQISAEQIKAFFANNKSEGPMQIAQWFGNYGVSLVPGYDAILKQVETEISSISHVDLIGFGFDEFHTAEDFDTLLNNIKKSYEQDISNRIAAHIADDTGGLSKEQLETYYSQIFGDLKGGGKYQETLNNEIESAKAMEKAFSELRKNHIANLANIEKTLETAQKNGPSCQKSDTEFLEEIKMKLEKERKTEFVTEGKIPAQNCHSFEETESLVKKINEDLNNLFENAGNQLYMEQIERKVARKNGEKLEGELEPDLAKYINKDVHENEPHNNSIAPANAAIAPVNANAAIAPVNANAAIAPANANAAIAPVNANAAIAPVNANTDIAPVFGTVKGDHSGALGD